MKLCFGQKVTASFRARLWLLCMNLAWGEEHASWLMACMGFETGELFSSKVRNGAGSGAIGLIQFMPATLKGMGYTVEQAAAMSPEEQLALVEKYFFHYAPRIHCLADMYMAILMPAYISSPLDAILFTDGTIAFRQNSGLDSSHDGKITKQEAAAMVQAKFDKGMKSIFVWEGNITA